MSFDAEETRIIEKCLQIAADVGPIEVVFHDALDPGNGRYDILNDLVRMSSSYGAYRDFEFCLLHELHHARQMRSGRLRLIEGIVLEWQGHIATTLYMMRFLDYDGYRALPWEAEANNYAYSVTGDFEPETGPIERTLSYIKHGTCYA
jgi:hypothetical protein